MRKKLATYALAGAVGVTGIAGAALVAPAVSYAASGDSSRLENRKVAAEVLGVTRDELRTAAREGRTLADLAREKDVSQDVLVDALATAENRRLAQAVRAGRLTQQQADQRGAGAEIRIRERLDDPIARHGGHDRRDSAATRASG